VEYGCNIAASPPYSVLRQQVARLPLVAPSGVNAKFGWRMDDETKANSSNPEHRQWHDS
jgi:hypothetical protein